jgi:hypothetical protein
MAVDFHKRKIFVDLDAENVMMFGKILSPDEYTTRVKIKGLLPQCLYGFHFNTNAKILNESSTMREYLVNGARSLTITRYCNCGFSRFVTVSLYCVKY